MPFIEKEKMKKGNIFGGACCLVLDVLSVRCFIDFQVKMLSKHQINRCTFLDFQGRVQGGAENLGALRYYLKP